MKNYIIALFVLFALFSCKNENNNTDLITTEDGTEETVSKKANLDGVWELVSFYNYEDNSIKDTIINNAKNRQVKMYNDGKVMWSRRAPSDQIDYFAYGAYSITDSSLTEVLDYGSVAMLKVIDTMRVFNFELILNNDTYSQIELGPEGDRVFSENYVRIKED